MDEQPIIINGMVAGRVTYSRFLKEWVALPVWSNKPLGFTEDRESAVELVRISRDSNRGAPGGDQC